MRDYLLELALRRRDKIASFVNSISLERYKDIIKNLWVEYEPKSVDVGGFMAVDGSGNLLDLKEFSVYSVIGYGVEKTPRETNQKMIGDVGVLTFPRSADVIRVLREICELKTALMSTQEMILIDGSLISLLINPQPIAGYIKFEDAYAETVKSLGSEIFQELWSSLQDQIKELGKTTAYYEDPFVSRLLIENKTVEISTGEVALLLLTLIEKLLTLRILLERNVRKSLGGSLVFVSKTSRSKLYYEKYYKQAKNNLNNTGRRMVAPSDMLIFNELIKSAGFSKPIVMGEVGVVKGLPSEGVLKELVRDFFNNTGLILSYIRLIRGGPVVKLEIPFNNTNSLTEEEAASIVENVIDRLNPLSYDGYPYPLLQVDRLSKITRDDVIALAYSLQVLPHWSGREVLGEWITYEGE